MTTSVSGSSATAPAQGKSRIWTDIDLDREGRQLGHLRLTLLTDGHVVPIPIAVFKNGPGPRILLLGGVHGDEFEGQVMMMKLMRGLDIANVQGHLIILSAANAPAAYAGTRVSPLDNGNLNRAYPGDPNGTPTQEIAYYIDSVLLPKVEYLLDFHSGGVTTVMTPSAHVYEHDDKMCFDRLLRMLEVFGMPTSVILKGLSEHGKKAIGACDRRGVLRFSTELGGGSGITVGALRRAEHGLARLLFDLGALRRPMTNEPAPPIERVRRLPNPQYIYAMASGIFEPYVELGQDVAAGQEAGAIHFPAEPWREPWVATFREPGRVYAVRAQALATMGDVLFMQSVPWP